MTERHPIAFAPQGASFEDEVLRALREDERTKAVPVIMLTARDDEMDKVMWEDLPNLPLYQKPTFLGIRSKFVNVGDNTTNLSAP